MANKLSQQEVDDFLAAYGFDPAANPKCADHITALADADNDTAVGQCLKYISQDRADGQPELPTFGLAAFRQEVEKYRAAQAPPPAAAAPPPAGPAAGPPTGPAATPPAGPPGPTAPGAPATTLRRPPRRPSRGGRIIVVGAITVVTLGVLVLVGWSAYKGLGWGDETRPVSSSTPPSDEIDNPVGIINNTKSFQTKQ